MLGGLSEFVSSCGVLSYPHVFFILLHICKDQKTKTKRKKSGGRCVPLCVIALRFSILAFLSFLLPFL